MTDMLKQDTPEATRLAELLEEWDLMPVCRPFAKRAKSEEVILRFPWGDIGVVPWHIKAEIRDHCAQLVGLHYSGAEPMDHPRLARAMELVLQLHGEIV